MSTSALEPIDLPAEAHGSPVSAAAAATAVSPLLDLRSRERVASRSAARRSATRPAARALRAAENEVLAVRADELERFEAARRAVAERAAARRAAVAAAAQRAAAARRVAARRAAASRVFARRAVPAKRAAVQRPATRRATRATTRRAPAGMAAVLAFARAQVGKSYASGADGPNSFDCSGFTKRAYAQAGLQLPHSSGAQAARARIVSRAAARPGDLVVGSGHVGVYMGNGMMIDAGNSRTGVVYRRLYRGLHIERF
ncbi:C40 family peptidase [Actinoplanes sp. NPDC051494]|uniref:C40 family peptidase n=1 Tax=Actinoplanes sp. NPDC051494 TaxID=3363907 RepID=UPI0037983F70